MSDHHVLSPEESSCATTSENKKVFGQPKVFIIGVHGVVTEFSDLLIKKTLELNGTITGEHGVGLHKKEYLIKEHGDNIPVMKSIKRTLDPNNIMNPGKIFDLN